MDKKTLFLLFSLGLVIAFAFFFLKDEKQNIPAIFNFGNYLDDQSATQSGRSTFSDLLITPTPSETPFPTFVPF